MLVELFVALLPTTWIVDAQLGPGAQFADLPAAVAAAVSGDTILVRAGTYTGFTLAGKALTIRGAGVGATFVGDAAGAQPSSAGTANGLTVLSGLRVDGSNTGLLVLSGQVVLLDCELHGGDLPFQGGTGLDVANGAHVTANRCALYGGVGLSSPPTVTFHDGGRAVAVGNGASFAGDRCLVRGGDCPGPLAGFHRGGSGVVCLGEVRFDHSHCRGGDSIQLPGAGLHSSLGGRVRMVGGTGAIVEAGQSASATGFAVNLSFGTAILHPPLTVLGAVHAQTQTGHAFPSFDVDGTALPDGATDALQPVVATFDGLVPNGAYFFAIAFAPSFSSALAPLADSELLLDLNMGGGWIGVLDAAGQFQFAFVPTQVFGGLLGVPVLGQAASFDPVAGALHTSNVDVRVYSL